MGATEPRGCWTTASARARAPSVFHTPVLYTWCVLLSQSTSTARMSSSYHLLLTMVTLTITLSLHSLQWLLVSNINYLHRQTIWCLWGPHDGPHWASRDTTGPISNWFIFLTFTASKKLWNLTLTAMVAACRITRQQIKLNCPSSSSPTLQNHIQLNFYTSFVA